MDPTLHEGQTIVASSLLNPRVGSIIVVRKDNKEIIKRVREVTEDKLVLIGDNAHPAHNMTVSRSSFVARQLL